MAKAFQAPKGTRDFYPREIHRRRFVERAWRDTSIRHAFDEIEGPTFEHLELYTAKSGEGIVSELFSFRREGGDDTYALRPEFTPTLARMFAARAPQLPRPTRWFWQQNCFRAERPQKGRLREFLQWNCDVIGLPSGDTSTPEGLLRAKASADAEVISACVGLLASLGLKPADVRVRYSHRGVLAGVISAMGVPEEHVPSAFVLLDRREKLDDAELEAMAFEFGVSSYEFITFLKRPRGRSSMEDVAPWLSGSDAALLPIRLLEQELATAGIQAWCELDLNIARGLAYYTGTVFEVHEASGSQRAVAGGGRYDNLIELFGGPPTPAVGFGMGDVVLSLVLEDRGLFPDGKDLLTALSAPLASLRPEAFVISNGVPEAEAAVRPLVSRLRAGTPGLRPLHARWTDKATRNIGKLLKDATDAHARTAIIIESASQCTLKDLDSGVQQGVPIDQVVAALASILGRS